MLLHNIHFFKYLSQKRLNTERIIISGLFTNSFNNRASCENILSNRTIFVQLLTMSVLPISYWIMVSLPSLHCGTEKTSRKVQTNPSCSNIKLYTGLTKLCIVLFNHSYRSDWQKCAQKNQILPAPQFQFCKQLAIPKLACGQLSE